MSKYTFEPIKINKNKYPFKGFLFNFSTYSNCTNSYGVYIFIEFWKISICLKPIGELTISY